MCRVHKACRSLARFLAVALAACGFVAAHAQALSANYSLTAPSVLTQPDAYSHAAMGIWGPVRLSAGRSTTGSGLSIDAGQNWFARAGVGRSFEGDAFSVGGGYRFTDDAALSMLVTRQLGQERLGLAVHYDWRQSYLRLSYDQPVIRTPGIGDRLRFSAGVRF